jgi:hypothetical protein
VANPKNKYGVNYLKIQNLTEGKYVLYLKKEEIEIPIEVHAGSFWNNV